MEKADKDNERYTRGEEKQKKSERKDDHKDNAVRDYVSEQEAFLKELDEQKQAYRRQKAQEKERERQLEKKREREKEEQLAEERNHRQLNEHATRNKPVTQEPPKNEEEIAFKGYKYADQPRVKARAQKETAQKPKEEASDHKVISAPSEQTMVQAKPQKTAECELQTKNEEEDSTKNSQTSKTQTSPIQKSRRKSTLEAPAKAQDNSASDHSPNKKTFESFSIGFGEDNGEKTKELSELFMKRKKDLADRLEQQKTQAPKKEKKQKSKEELIQLRKNMVSKKNREPQADKPSSTESTLQPQGSSQKSQQPEQSVAFEFKDIKQKATKSKEPSAALIQRLAGGARPTVPCFR